MIHDDYWEKLILLMVWNDFFNVNETWFVMKSFKSLQGTLTTDADSLKAYEDFHSLLSNNLELKKVYCTFVGHKKATKHHGP